MTKVHQGIILILPTILFWSFREKSDVKLSSAFSSKGVLEETNHNSGRPQCLMQSNSPPQRNNLLSTPNLSLQLAVKVKKLAEGF